MLNEVCYCLITSDYRSDNTLQCDSKHTIEMRARLSTISNITSSQLLTMLQSWIRNSSKIIVNGEVLTVTSIYFLPISSTPELNSTSPSHTSSYETNMKNIVILFTASGSAGGFLLLICACCIIISVRIIKKLKSKRNYKLKPKFVVNTISNNVMSLQYIYRVHKILGREDDNEEHYHLVEETKFYNEQYFVCDINNISPNK